MFHRNGELLNLTSVFSQEEAELKHSPLFLTEVTTVVKTFLCSKEWMSFALLKALDIDGLFCFDTSLQCHMEVKDSIYGMAAQGGGSTLGLESALHLPGNHTVQQSWEGFL